MSTITWLKQKAIETRMGLLQMIYDGKTGHTGGALSSTDILVALHYEIMKLRPEDPKWADRDKFVLSKGHSVEGYYVLLADLGYFPKEELKTFSKYQSRLIGHPTVKVPGIEMNTGALGHGLSVAIGMAMAAKMDGRGSRVFVLMGDGEQAEGSVWEAAMAAGHYGLDNLIAVIDRNRLQISGSTEDVMRLDSLKDKWSAFGWAVRETDGNNMEELVSTFRAVPFVPGKPTLVLANTVKGKGVSYMENVAKWHHGVPTAEQLEQAMTELTQQLKEVEAE